jgi:glycosyltransferase involved in cell wall biosynthesis
MKKAREQNLHSFVIPVYKESIYLEACIISLTKQTIPSNIVIATSTPTDATKKLALKYDIEYHIYSGQQNGIANDWNFALSKATTTFATIAHQDDIYEPSYVEEVLKKAKKTEDNSLILFTDYYDFINEKNRKISLNAIIKKVLLLPFLIKSTHRNRLVKKSILVFGDAICCPTVTFNMRNLEDFSFSDEYKCALDWIAWLEIAEMDGTFNFINKRLVKHRIHSESETSMSLTSGIRRKEEEKIFKQIFGNTVGGFFTWFYAIGHKDNSV